MELKFLSSRLCPFPAAGEFFVSFTQIFEQTSTQSVN